MTEEQRGVLGAVQDVTGRLIGALPAQFLCLVGLNVVFILGLLWFLDHQVSARERVISQVLTACLQAEGHR